MLIKVIFTTFCISDYNLFK